MSLLPTELKYLEPVAKQLAKIPPDDLNEDVDASKLEAALRNRVKGLELRDAISQLTKDNEALQKWIKEKNTDSSAIFFISAYLMRPGPLARQLLAPPSASTPEPTVSIELAADWKATVGVQSILLTKGKVFCGINILDKQGFDIYKHKSDHRQALQKGPQNPWANLGIWTKTPVRFGECHGEKSSYVQLGETNWKRVGYLLEVPGGYLNANLGHKKGKDFDEMEFENKFHTLKVISPFSLAS